MQTDQSIDEQIRFLEQHLLQPEARASPEELGNMLADDFVEFGSSGRVYDKQQIIAALQKESGWRISLLDFQVKLVSKVVALATYRTVHCLEPEGETRYALRSSIWKYDQERWQIVFHQGTPIGFSA